MIFLSLPRVDMGPRTVAMPCGPIVEPDFSHSRRAHRIHAHQCAHTASSKFLVFQLLTSTESPTSMHLLLVAMFMPGITVVRTTILVPSDEVLLFDVCRVTLRRNRLVAAYQENNVTNSQRVRNIEKSQPATFFFSSSRAISSGSPIGSGNQNACAKL